MKLATKEEMRSIDRNSTKEYGIPSLILMENAGNAVFQYIRDNIPRYREKKFLVFCGAGNNGGDGAVVARKLFLDGVYVRAVFVSDISKANGDNRVNFEIMRNIGVPAETVTEQKQWQELRLSLYSFDCIIDAIFGTGFHGEIGEQIATVIQFVNSCRESGMSRVIALDIPSGVYADGGIANVAVKADVTVTFGLPKLSMVDFPVREFVGELVTADISIPRDLLKDRSLRYNLLTPADVTRIYQPRVRNSHKGSYGHVLVLGGAEEYSGALVFAAVAALRAGAGLVTAAGSEEATQALRNTYPEVMTLSVDWDDPAGTLAELQNFIAQRNISTVLAGNGWGIGEGQKEVLRFLLKNPQIKSLILDADGINNITGERELLKNHDKEIILTPHVGEMARLMERDTSYVKNFKADCARDFAVKNKALVVLKDAISVAAFPDGQAWFSDRGSASLAKGGSGDVLAGIIAGLRVSGYSGDSAVLLGMYILGRCGELYEEQHTAVSALTREHIDMIPIVFREIEKNS